MKTIEICGKEYPILCNSIVYAKYREFFETDIFSDIKILQTFLTKQALLTKQLKEENPDIEDTVIISSLSNTMLDDMGIFMEAATRMAYMMIYIANKKIEKYEKWLESIPSMKTNDEWIAEVAEYAVSCFC